MRRFSEFNGIKVVPTQDFLVFAFLAVLIIILLSFNPCYSEQFPDCLKCHKDKVEGKYDHPTTCVSCHTKAHITGTKKDFPRYLFAQGVDLCWGCHGKKKFLGKVGHPPVEKGECLSCHDVHTTDYKSLIPLPMTEFCFKCHENADFIKKSKHPPVAEGKCMGCHDVHKSEVKKLLLAEMPKECFLCHTKDKYVSDAKLKHHSPVATGRCLDCHEPHSSDANKLLIKAMPDVCFLCHYGPDFKNKYVHPNVAAGECMKCHEPHQSDVKKLLLERMPELCYNCHDEGEFTRKVPHPIVKSGLCMVCHDPHAGPGSGLLYYHVTDLCLLCHTSRGQKPHASGGVLEAGHPLRGRKDPSSKSGELTCMSCHVGHSSDHKYLWRYPATTATELCKACHKYGKKDKK